LACSTIIEGNQGIDVRKSFQEDWTLLPFLTVTLLGFIVAVLDFVFLQNLKFQVTGLAGLLLLLVGGYVRSRARLELKKKADSAASPQQEDSRSSAIIASSRMDSTNTFDIQYT